MRILDMMRQVNDEGRNALRGLRRTNNASQDIALALSSLSQELKGTNDTTFKVVVEGSARPLLPIVRDEVYRIGREAVINAFRHSRAKNITVEMSYLEKQLRFVIIDDGCGINAEVLQSGRAGHWGLSGMRERADRIKARLKVRSRVGSGTEVELSVPGNVAFQDHSDESRLKSFFKLLRRKPPVAVTETSKGSETMSEQASIRILSVDDHPLLREGIAVLIENQPDMVLVGQASTGVEAIQQFRQHKPDVTLMDLRLPDISGIDALIAIRAEHPDASL